MIGQVSDCLYLLFVKLDESVVGFIEVGEFVEPEDQDQGHFVEQGKPLSDHTHTHKYLFYLHVLLRSNNGLKIFSKLMKSYFATYVEV